MNPSSKRCSARSAAALLCVGCAATSVPGPVTAARSPTSERRAPGVADVQTLTLPAPERAGESREQLLVLRAPTSTESARRTVQEFLHATVNEASDRLEPLLTEQAVVDTGSGRQPARAFWQLRFSQLDYTELRGQLLYRDADLQIVRAEDVARLPATRRVPLELAQGEVAVRVPIRLSWAGHTRLYGDELLFRLEPSGARFEISEISEDFRLP
jgi:hypothetical protein